jgi:hypothetical protein
LFSTYIHFESCTVNTSNYIFTYFVYLFFYTFTLEVYSYIILLLHLFVFLLFEIFNVHHNNIVTKATLGCLNRGNQFITMPSQFSPIVQFCDSSAVWKVRVPNKKLLSVRQKNIINAYWIVFRRLNYVN